MTDLLNARLAIERLIVSYAEYVDNGDIEALAELFKRGSIMVEGQEQAVVGKENVKNMFVSFTRFYNDCGKEIDILSEKGRPFTRHLSSNLYFELLQLDTAIVHSSFTVIQALPGVAMQPIISGRYKDTLAYARDEGWFFLERYQYIDLVGELSRHLKINPF